MLMATALNQYSRHVLQRHQRTLDDSFRELFKVRLRQPQCPGLQQVRITNAGLTHRKGKKDQIYEFLVNPTPPPPGLVPGFGGTASRLPPRRQKNAIDRLFLDGFPSVKPYKEREEAMKREG